MPSPNYPRLESLFHAARDLPAAERPQFLKRECGDHHSLRHEVECLLKGHAQPVEKFLALPGRKSTSGELEGATITSGINLGKYLIQEKLDEGGMGLIYRAWHTHLEMPVVVKVLRASMGLHRELVQRFLNEARAAARIRDPGIVRVFDVDRHECGNLYIVMELLDGETLQTRLQRRGRVSCSQAIQWIRQVARTLAVAHAQGIVHRDLKPSNMFLVRDPEVPGGERIKLLDFGIAKLMETPDELSTGVGIAMGTPPYMAPEQFVCAANVDHRADLYSLGVILFEAICGQRPFQADSYLGYEQAHLSAPIPAPSAWVPTVPVEMDRLVFELLAKQPRQRLATASEVIRRLYEIQARLPGELALALTVNASREQQTEPRPSLTDLVELSLADLDGIQEPGPTQSGSAPLPTSSDSPEPGTSTRSMSVWTRSYTRLVVRWRGGAVLVGALVSLTWALWLGIRLLATDPDGSIEGLGQSSLGSPVVSTLPVVSVPVSDDPRAFYRQLREWLDTAHLETRLDIIDTLAAVGPRSAATLLKRALDNQSAQVRLQAAEALVALDWRAGASWIRDAYKQSAGGLRVQLAACLMMLGNDDAAPALRRELERQSALRLVAAVALARGPGDRRALRHVRHVLAERPASTDSWRRAVEVLMARGERDARTQLVQELSRQEPARSLFAAETLARYGEPKGLEYLRMKLREPLFPRRLEAALALARVGDVAALDPVGAWLASNDARTRRAAVQIAGRLAGRGGENFRATIGTLINDDNYLVRMAAHAAMLAFSDLAQRKGETP